MSNRDVAVSFVQAFCYGDINALEAVLAEEFSLRGPLFDFHSKSDYIESLRADGMDRGECEILGMVGANEVVAVFYSYRKPTSVTTVAQMFWFVDGQISKTLLEFDPKGI